MCECPNCVRQTSTLLAKRFTPIIAERIDDFLIESYREAHELYHYENLEQIEFNLSHYLYPCGQSCCDPFPEGICYFEWKIGICNYCHKYYSGIDYTCNGREGCTNSSCERCFENHEDEWNLYEEGRNNKFCKCKFCKECKSHLIW